MTLLAFIFRLLLFLFVFRLAGIVLRTFFGGFFQGAKPKGPLRGDGGPNRSEPVGQIEELVQDPICGVHTVRSSAIVGRYQGAAAYFCSDVCAEKARAK